MIRVTDEDELDYVRGTMPKEQVGILAGKPVQRIRWVQVTLLQHNDQTYHVLQRISNRTLIVLNLVTGEVDRMCLDED